MQHLNILLVNQNVIKEFKLVRCCKKICEVFRQYLSMLDNYKLNDLICT